MKLFWTMIFLLKLYPSGAQDNIRIRNGLKILENEQEYVKKATADSDLALMDVKKIIPGIHICLRYSTDSNFTGQKIYPAASTAYLRKKAVTAMMRIQHQLTARGMGLKIFDAYRPYSVTELIWRLVKDERYAANPIKGSNHNRGIAVDCTIIDIQSNEELNMGTGFDNFSDTAHHGFKDLPEAVLKNRLLLRKIMEENGFKAMETEWWHYTLPDADKYDLLDLSFEQLSKYQPKINPSNKPVQSSVPAASDPPVQKR